MKLMLVWPAFKGSFCYHEVTRGHTIVKVRSVKLEGHPIFAKVPKVKVLRKPCAASRKRKRCLDARSKVLHSTNMH